MTSPSRSITAPKGGKGEQWGIRPSGAVLDLRDRNPGSFAGEARLAMRGEPYWTQIDDGLALGNTNFPAAPPSACAI